MLPLMLALVLVAAVVALVLIHAASLKLSAYMAGAGAVPFRPILLVSVLYVVITGLLGLLLRQTLAPAAGETNPTMTLVALPIHFGVLAALLTGLCSLPIPRAAFTALVNWLFWFVVSGVCLLGVVALTRGALA